MGCPQLIFAVLLLGAVSSGSCAEEQSLTKAKEGLALSRKPCPICDSSVYPYCSEKLLHDACCCLDPYDTPLPYQCNYADCSFLHANSCLDHKLITRCCCNRAYFFLKRK